MLLKIKVLGRFFTEMLEEPFSQRTPLSYNLKDLLSPQRSCCETGSSDVEGSLWNHLDKKGSMHHEAPLFLRVFLAFLNLFFFCAKIDFKCLFYCALFVFYCFILNLTPFCSASCLFFQSSGEKTSQMHF